MTYEAKMRFHDLNGMTYCTPCKERMLANVDAALAAYAGASREEIADEIVQPRDFEALGPRPWAGEEEPYRYVQCDGCNGQWGPDA